MLFSKKITWFLIHSNLIVSISGGILVYGITRLFALQHNWIYALLITLLIFSVYTLQRIVDESGFSPSEPSVWNKNKSIATGLSILSLLSAIIIGIIIFNSSLLLVVLTLFFAFLCYWYTVPFFGGKLREIPGVKIIVTAFTWVYACAFFPLVNEGISLEQAGLFSLLLTLYLIAIILPFDIRDIHTDYFSQSTIPQNIGVSLTKLLGTFLLTVFLTGNFIFDFISPGNWLFTMAVALQIVLLLLSSEKRNFLYFGLIDCSIIVLGCSYLL